MTRLAFQPPYVPLSGLDHALHGSGFALVSAGDVQRWLHTDAEQLAALHASWDDLPSDAYLMDGGRYRRRRHSCFVVDESGRVTQVPHRAHWQPVEYNALHGGMQRWFEPMKDVDVAQPAWPRLLRSLAGAASALKGPRTWYIEAHQFRIDTAGGIGRPTPEGAHRDGVDLVAVYLVARKGIKGGETRVFEAAGPNGQRFTLAEPWSLLLLDDERVIHESTPIQPLDVAEQGAQDAHRDTLVLTCRARSFQDESPL